MMKSSLDLAALRASRSETTRLRMADAGRARLGAPVVSARVDANVRRHVSAFWGYVAVLGFLTLVAAASMTMALWRLFHFAR